MKERSQFHFDIFVGRTFIKPKKKLPSWSKTSISDVIVSQQRLLKLK